MSLHQEIITDYNADCAEFMPSTCSPDWLAVGTYQLEESTSTRIGRLYVYSLVGQTTLTAASTLDVPGIFDLKWWQGAASRWVVSLALADGTLRLIDTKLPKLEASFPQDLPDASSVALEEVSSCLGVSSGMALSLDWGSSTEPCSNAKDLAALSGSEGTLSLAQATPSKLEPLCEWSGHELEVWMASFDQHQVNTADRSITEDTAELMQYIHPHKQNMNPRCSLLQSVNIYLSHVSESADPFAQTIFVSLQSPNLLPAFEFPGWNHLAVSSSVKEGLHGAASSVSASA
jgi:hypothetical protein